MKLAKLLYVSCDAANLSDYAAFHTYMKAI